MIVQLSGQALAKLIIIHYTKGNVRCIDTLTSISRLEQLMPFAEVESRAALSSVVRLPLLCSTL